MSRLLLSGIVASVLALACPEAFAAGEVEVKMGSAVKKLEFKDIRYLIRTLDDLPKSKAYVLVFTYTTCPIAQRYLPTLNKLEKEYRKRVFSSSV